MARIPKHCERFQKRYPEVWKAYHELGAAAHAAGPLDARARELVKLALEVGIGSEGAVHSHVRKSLELEIGPDEIRQVAILALPTVGFPRMMAALSWVDDLLDDKG
ncbi:MAG: carboxymuconolactone decarboxylase family protein [Chloroflexi bacterium]|nr:carboxymuconolactone decarboxylase family protein [Chloroflexota bacterium]